MLLPDNMGSTADSAGNYRFTGVAAGSHTLLVQNVDTKILIPFSAESSTVIPTVTLQGRSLEEVTIAVRRNMNQEALTIGKMPVKPMDLPQSTSFVPREALEARQVTTLSDAVGTFNGVYIMGNTGGVQQEIAARGFALASTNTFKNGVRYNNAVMPEVTSLERVEILKGSNAILFGNVAAGGVLNLVTKKPTYRWGGEVAMRAGSYAYYKPSFDVNGLLGSQRAAFRVNGTFESSGSFRDNVSGNRKYINPSLSFRLGARTTVLLEGDYLDDRRTNDYGVGSINYTLIDVPRSRFVGATWSHYNTVQKSITATITHTLSRQWQLKYVAGGQDFGNDLFSTMRPNANKQMVAANGDWIRGVQRSHTSEKYGINELDVTGTVRTGQAVHHLLAGADADIYSTEVLNYASLDHYDTINILQPAKFTQRSDIPDLRPATLTRTPIRRAGAYVQDLAEITRYVRVLAGVRASYLETGSSVSSLSDGSQTTSVHYDHAFSPRVGLVIRPLPELSVFTSFATSFAPNTGVDIDGKALAPSDVAQTEAGVKSTLFHGFLAANLTAYKIVNHHVAQATLVNGNTNSNIKELAGEITSKGIELDIMSRSWNGWTAMAGYSYNETRYTRSNTYIVGSLLRYNPNHTANGSVFYTIGSGPARGLQLGATAVYIGERQAGRSTRVTVKDDPYKLMPLPAYTTIDANIGYAIRKTTIRVKVSNVGNALSYNVHDDNSVNPIAPRQFLCTVSQRF